VRERELEMQAIEGRLHDLDHGLCPHCDYRVERDFVRCPSCLRKLKERCVGCQRPLDQEWVICPYCETEVPGALPARRRRRRREQTGGEESLLIESASSGDRDSLPERDSALEPKDDRSTIGQPAATPAGRAAGEGARATTPVAASETASSRSRNVGRAGRPGGRPGPAA
jgi:Double zinc ribbon